MVFARSTRCLLAINSAVNKEGRLCAGAANSNVHTYFRSDVIANNCVGKRVPATLTTLMHVTGL